jgi:hypothetical protein
MEQESGAKPPDLARQDGRGFKMRPLLSAGTKGAECGKIRVITKNILRHPNLMCLHGEVEWQKGPKPKLENLSLHTKISSNFSQPVTMPALHFDAECLGLEDPETPEDIRKEWGSVFAILSDYVQPDSTLSLDEAIDRVAEFYTDGYLKPPPINHILIILGDQIPYDNPAHTKLADFFPALGKSRKWVVKSVHVRTLISF